MTLPLSAHTSVFWVGLLSGTLLLCAGTLLGLGLGIWQAGRRGAPGMDQQRMVETVGRLISWSQGMANEMSHYGAVVDLLSQLFREPGGVASDPQRAATARVLTDVVDANGQLQDRLNQAEAMLKQQAEELSIYMSEARTDPLTRLANRRAFDEELDKRVSEWRRYQISLSVLCIDIDYFKRCNDTHGHQAGDAVLAGVAKVLQSTLRQSDMVARIGGEEFAAILPSTAHTEACRTAERVREAVEQAEFDYKGQPIRVTVSVGAAELRDDEEPGRMMSRGDAALYTAKQEGRNRAYWHDGHRCLPIGAASPDLAAPERHQPRAARLSNSPRKEEEEFCQVCDNLRQRLAEVTRANCPEPAVDGPAERVQR